MPIQPAPGTPSAMPCQRSCRRGLPVGFAACLIALAGPVAAVEPPPVVFDGLGLAGFEGSGSVASALRQAGPAAPEATPSPVEFRGIAVQGPSGRDPVPVPLAAEVRSRIDRIDVAAGLLADPTLIETGPARWTGRIGLATRSEIGRESLELRTMLAPGHERSTIGVALGPRLERRLGNGITFFLDGQAEAQAMRSAEAGWWTLRGTSTADLTMLGVTATTGLVR